MFLNLYALNLKVLPDSLGYRDNTRFRSSECRIILFDFVKNASETHKNTVLRQTTNEIHGTLYTNFLIVLFHSRWPSMSHRSSIVYPYMYMFRLHITFNNGVRYETVFIPTSNTGIKTHCVHPMMRYLNDTYRRLCVYELRMFGRRRSNGTCGWKNVNVKLPEETAILFSNDSST